MYAGTFSKLRQQTSGHHPRTSDKLGRLHVQQASHARNRYHKRFTDRQTAIFSRYFATCIGCHGHGFPHEETRDWTRTRTQRDSCDDERRIRLPGYDFSTIQSFYHFTLTSDWGFLASCFWTDLRLYSSSASCRRWYGYCSVYDPTTKISSYDSVSNSGVSLS